jgi:membrane protein DedA with SNARE-associated domain
MTSQDERVVATDRADVSTAPEPGGQAHRPRIGWKDVLCVGPLALNFVYAYAGIPLDSLLIGKQPVLLSAVRGAARAIIVAGALVRDGRVPLVVALLAPLPVSVFFDPFWFWVGRRYGRRLLDYMAGADPRWRKRIARGERFFRRFGFWTILIAPVLPVGGLVLVVAAGEAGMPFLVFLLADIIGNLLYISLYLAIGWVIGEPAIRLAQLVSNYAWYVVGGTFAIIIGWSLWTSLRAPRDDG